MKNNKVLLFDLDGTIADTLFVVINIYNTIVAPKLRCKPVKWEDKLLLQNKPIGQLFKQYKITWYKLPIVIYLVKRELQRQIHTILPFADITTVLQKLKQLGFTMGIVTSNSKKNAQYFLQQHRINELFDFVYTNRNIFGKHTTLNWLVKKHQFNKNNILYIGDETRDIHAARKSGIGILAVSWGYLGKELLADRNPDAVVDHPLELEQAIERYFFVDSGSLKS